MLGKKRLTWVLLAIFLTADVALLLSVVFAPKSTSSILLPTAEYLEQNPAPTPEFIHELWILPDRVCIDVSQRLFARVSVSAEELNQYIIQNERFTIDAVHVQPAGNIFTGGPLSLQDGKQYGGDITFCFNTTNLTAGLHLATLTIPDFDGVEHIYSWAFRYDPNAPTSDPNVMPTLIILPTETPAN